MTEGSLKAPIRHPLEWQEEAFYDEEALDAEMRRVFDICHGCRRCFNLCDTFPQLFDLIDQSPSQELDTVSSDGFQGVVDACTLCDMCFMTKCPYVPPHPFNLDFPHLILRYRAVEQRKSSHALNTFGYKQLTETDRNAKLARPVSKLVNWATHTENTATRAMMEKVVGMDRRAALPTFSAKTLVQSHEEAPLPLNTQGRHYGRKVVLYATCYGNYNTPSIGLAARAILAYNGVEVEVLYPECCGMPQLEYGNLPRVAEKAQRVAQYLLPWVEKGYDVVALIPSCALMLKLEWPLIASNVQEVTQLSQASYDLSEYIVSLANKGGLQEGLAPLGNDVTLHIACHARAQNMGRKAAELLKLIPDTPVHVIERCSGHGGVWGTMVEHFETALKVGKPVAENVLRQEAYYLVSECPLAATHIGQGVSFLSPESQTTLHIHHPIELLAMSYEKTWLGELSCS